MKVYPWFLRFLLPVLLTASWASAQVTSREPHIGYIYPSGGQQATSVEICVGGQFLDGVKGILVSGGGIGAEVLKHRKPLNPRQANLLREKMGKAQAELREAIKNGQVQGKMGNYELLRQFAEKQGVTQDELEALEEFRKQRTDPKRQENPQIAERLTLRLQIDPDATPGSREFQIVTTAGLSNPLYFQVGTLAEYMEQESEESTVFSRAQAEAPFVLNGQVMPGDVDRFAFHVPKGAKLVVSAQARSLIPYLADAVPGWFQATVALYDKDGREVAYADDYRFDPDPVLFYEIPDAGDYVVEIRDALYRGREDFVYRLVVGEVPFVTSVFPMGGQSGTRTRVKLQGWNLETDTIFLNLDGKARGKRHFTVRSGSEASNPFPFMVDDIEDLLEAEPNNSMREAQEMTMPQVINGRIDKPADKDIFRFSGKAGQRISVEVRARRLNSPLDSLLILTDKAGNQLVVNDDFQDKAEGLTTHHADSQVTFTLPEDGDYFIWLSDTQSQGGEAFAYRLRVSPAWPDFELRLVPSVLSARVGSSVPVTVYAIRKEGFDGDISLHLKGAPPGFSLSGAWVPAGCEEVRMTLTTPQRPVSRPVQLRLEGCAAIGGDVVCRDVVPAQDLMQAFIYHHLVPSKGFVVSVRGQNRSQAVWRWEGKDPVKLEQGKSATVQVQTLKRWLLEQVQLELNKPPEGISIESVTPVQNGLAIRIHADAGKFEGGLKGNLILDAFMERTATSKTGKEEKRRFPIGNLPAIPFEVVGG